MNGLKNAQLLLTQSSALITMASVSTYLNFPRSTEEAFLFYRSVFKTEFSCPISRMGDAPSCDGQPPMSDEDKKLIMHVSLPILGGHVLMGTDAPESMGFNLVQGTHTFINLQPDTRAETDRLFAELGAGGKIGMPLQEMFWGAYFGTLTDRLGIQWMFNCEAKS